MLKKESMYYYVVALDREKRERVYSRFDNEKLAMECASKWILDPMKREVQVRKSMPRFRKIINLSE